MLRIRAALLDYFPAALVAYQLGTLTLTSPDVLALLAKAPTPAEAAKLTTAQITAALKKAGRRGDVPGRAAGSRPRCAPNSWGSPTSWPVPTRPRSARAWRSCRP